MTRNLLLAATFSLSIASVPAFAKTEAAKDAPKEAAKEAPKAAAAKLPAKGAYSAGTYQIDGTHSKVGFEVTHLMISTVDGKFTKFDGTVDMAEKFDKSKVNMTVDINSIDTSEPKRDTHLKSPEFFDVAKFPTMKFESTAIKGKPANFKLTGNLTLHGVTKPVTFDASYKGTVLDGYGNQKAIFTAKAKISRKEFGLNWNSVVEAGPVVGDEVTLNLALQAARQAKQLASETAEAN